MTASSRAEAPPRRGPGRRLSTFLSARPRLRLSLLLAGPVAWLVVVYLGSLAVLFVSAFWQVDPFTTQIDRTFDAAELRGHPPDGRLPDDHAANGRHGGGGHRHRRRDRVPDRVLHGQGGVAHGRGVLLVVAILMPLWASYLVQVYAWRIILSEDGILNWALEPFGLKGPGLGYRQRRALARVQLHLAAVHDPADLRGPRADPGLADRGFVGSRRAKPAHLPPGGPADRLPGDRRRLDLHLLADARRLHHPACRSASKQFIGNVVYDNVGVANNLPFAAAYATVPVLIMVVYLAVARRLGAFEAPLMARAGSRDGSCAAGRGSTLALPLLPDRPDRALRVQRRHHPEPGRSRATRPSGSAGARQRGRPRRALALAQGRARRDRARDRARLAGRASPCTASASSAARRSRSSSSCRSRCPGIVTGMALNRRSPRPVGIQFGLFDDHHRPRDLLHRRRLQQRARAAAADAAVARGGLHRSRRRRLADVPLRARFRSSRRRWSRARCSRSRSRSTR